VLTTDNTALVIIDVQGKLARLMSDADLLFVNLSRITQAAVVLSIPIIWAEQLPNKLGPTINEIARHLTHHRPIAKETFSCCGNTDFMDALNQSHCKNLLVVGIEAHICVTQTVLVLLQNDFNVHLISDAIGSRTKDNKEIAIERCRQKGAVISSVEMALFELMGSATHEHFKAIQSIIK
jgi:nicotinamidase-related amidase